MTISKRTTYQRVKAAVAEPTEQVAILLEYAAKEIVGAELALDDNKYEKFSIHVEKALSVVNGLCSVLQEQDKVSNETAGFINEMTGFYAGLIMKLSRLTKENYKQICPIIISDAQAMAKLWRDSKEQSNEIKVDLSNDKKQNINIDQ
jgi:flagellin-specific chaperone FliS